jgi:hypothetical protein
MFIESLRVQNSSLADAELSDLSAINRAFLDTQITALPGRRGEK